MYEDRGQNIDVDDEDDFLLGMTQAAKQATEDLRSIKFKIFFQTSAPQLGYPDLEQKKEELAWSEEVEEAEQVRIRGNAMTE